MKAKPIGPPLWRPCPNTPPCPHSDFAHDIYDFDRHEINLLRALLRKVPYLVTDLAPAIAKQARLGEVGRSRKPRRPSEQPLPYNADALAAADELHNVIGGWVRLVCEQRGVEFRPVGWLPATFIGPLRPGQHRMYPGYVPTTVDLAFWLDRNLVSLAMTEGAETVRPELKAAVLRAHRIACPPKLTVVIDQHKLNEARALCLNANGVATLARELGEEYRHLSRRRVHVLHEAELIKPIPGPWRKDWVLFKVGEVLDAHLVLPIRERHARAS
ncbi:hypothetical protein [Nocardia gipuzkoensis]|uniref:hypothetical protein n=3 Tax=Nocardia TaxID=1817 RepID=UPI0024553658|nr:hypothetical protein [Nocardia gipuzkoensis]